MRALPLLTAALLLWGGAAAAQDKTCVARVNHLDVVIDPALLGEGAAATPTRRERLRDWPARRWNRALGRPPACDSQTTIAFLASYLDLSQTEGYCLADDPEAGYLLVPGTRNYRGRCTATVCERVNMARDETLQAAGSIAGIVTGRSAPQPGDEAAGRSPLAGFAHSSGAMLLSGNASSIGSALGGAASSVAAALSAPAVAAAAAVSVVAVGGAVYVCSN